MPELSKTKQNEHNPKKQNDSFNSRKSIVRNCRLQKEARNVDKLRFCDYLSLVSSITYCLLLVIIGILLYAGDLVSPSNSEGYNESHYSEQFNLFLSIVGILGLSWLIFDIQSYINKISFLYSMDSQADESEDGDEACVLHGLGWFWRSGCGTSSFLGAECNNEL